LGLPTAHGFCDQNEPNSGTSIIPLGAFESARAGASMHVGIMVLIIGSGIVTSRKRKLREFFAVCDNDGPIPHINLENIDAPPTNAAEAHFLEVTDILQYVALSICGGLKSIRFFVGLLVADC